MKALFPLLLTALLATAFGVPGANAQTPDSQPAQKFTAKDLQKLKWIIGDWKGTGDIDKPFFERYRFEGASVLAVDELESEADTAGGNTTRFSLTDGVLGNVGASRWQASLINNEMIKFVPVAGARNSFIWEKVSKDEWRATLEWPATADRPARKRVYKMERIVRK